MNKRFRKDDKVNKNVKYDNDFLCNSVHNFNKYSVSDFNKISSIDSKFDTLNKFHKALKKLQGVKIKNENTNQRKITVLKNASLLYANLVDIYKKEYDQTFENKDKN